MLRKSSSVTINEESFEIVVNVGTMIDVENETGKDFMSLSKSTETGSLLAFAQLLAVCLKKDGKSVGMQFIKDMDLEQFGSLFDPLIDAIISAFPTEKKKKEEVKTETAK